MARRKIQEDHAEFFCIRQVKILAQGPDFGYPQRGFALLEVH